MRKPARGISSAPRLAAPKGLVAAPRLAAPKGLVAAPRLAARGLIRAYQLSLSSLIGRQCRYLPSCSAFTDEAIDRHGLWAGGWMGLSRICRCNPWGGSGFDPVPAALPPGADALRPWRYGQWRQSPVCEAIPAKDAKE